jgi:Leucyl-tRNA synthetase
MAYECLEMLGEKEINSWPKVVTKLILKEKIKMAIQINVKTRVVIEIEKGIDQVSVERFRKDNLKVKEKLSNGPIKKIIFVKDRIINFIIES